MAHMTNPLATVDQLHQRSSFSGVPSDLQDVIFFATQCITQTAGVLLRIPQSVTSKANIVLARFLLVEHPLAYEFSDISAAALYLVAKLSAHPVPSRDVCNVYAYLQSPNSAFFKTSSRKTAQEDQNNYDNNGNNGNNDKGKEKADPASYYLSETEYTAFRSRLLALEARILYSVSFNIHVALPHPLAITYLQALDFLGRPRREVAARAVGYLNAALLSPQLLYLTHQPHMLAVAAVYGAARDARARMPACAWWGVFDVDREELGFLVVAMRSLEPWARPHRQQGVGLLSNGMITRRMVEAEMSKRGLRFGNGSAAQVGTISGGVGSGSGGNYRMEDEEAALMRRMDERSAQLQM